MHKKRVRFSFLHNLKSKNSFFGIVPITPFLALALPHFYTLLIVVILLIILLYVSLSTKCCCYIKAKYPPKVRLIAYSEGKIFLEENQDNKLDTPFCDIVEKGQIPKEAIKSIIDQHFNTNYQIALKQLINYCYQDKTKNDKHLVHLFVARVKEADLSNIGQNTNNGKWYEVKALEKTEYKELIGNKLMEELPCLKETILLAQSLCKK